MAGVEIDRDACVGAGQCTLTAPGVFDQDDDGLVVLVPDGTDTDTAISEAVALCPARAISLRQ